ncbi:hypothetical protein GW17_00046200 [Ensete ventricosum]|nr:hypothetical protein GW17_00046200 [Ensete ventricosum]
MPTTGIRAPIQNSNPSQTSSAAQSMQQNLGKPGLDNHMLQNLGSDIRTTVNLKNQGALNVDDKVLYKSRCDNRLNEITERASADRREVPQFY